MKTRIKTADFENNLQSIEILPSTIYNKKLHIDLTPDIEITLKMIFHKIDKISDDISSGSIRGYRLPNHYDADIYYRKTWSSIIFTIQQESADKIILINDKKNKTTLLDLYNICKMSDTGLKPENNLVARLYNSSKMYTINTYTNFPEIYLERNLEKDILLEIKWEIY